MRVSIIVFSAVTLWSCSVHAQQKAATACAADLSAPALQIYDAVTAVRAPFAEVAQIVRERTIALVQAGHIPMSTAPDHASAAARCLDLRR